MNKNISPCQAIFNFYPVDASGAYDSNPSSTFTLVRAPDVKIAGTILAPQGNKPTEIRDIMLIKNYN